MDVIALKTVLTTSISALAGKLRDGVVSVTQQRMDRAIQFQVAHRGNGEFAILEKESSRPLCIVNSTAVLGDRNTFDKANYFKLVGLEQLEFKISTSKRPFYIIGHHANTQKKFDDYIEQGANFIEMDIHNYTRPFHFANGNGTDEIYIIHMLNDEFTRQYTNSDGVDAYFANVKKKLDEGKLCGIILDCKPTLVSDGPIHYSSSYPNPRDYGRRVANYMKRHGIPANRVIMGVDEMTYDHTVYVGNNTPSGSQWAKSWAEMFMLGVRVDAKYDCLLNLYVDPSVVNDWTDRITAKSDVASLGMDEKVRSDFDSNWKPNLQKLIQLRNKKKGDLRFNYFWTVNNDNDLRKCLAEDVDGIITDVPAILKAILNEPAYQAKYRLATAADYPISRTDRVKRSLEDPYIYISFNNRAAFDSWFQVSYTGPDGKPKTWKSGKCMAGQGSVCPVPRTVANITVTGSRLDGAYPAVSIKGGANRSFEMSGTLFKGWFTRK